MLITLRVSSRCIRDHRRYHHSETASLCCSHEKSSELRWDDHDEFDEASQQGEAERKPSDERQPVQSESAV